MRIGLLVLAAIMVTGCQGGTGVLRRWGAQNDATLASPITEDELGDNRNMVARWFNPKSVASSKAFNASLALAPTKIDPETVKEISAAEDLFQQGRLAEAEKALLTLEKKKTKIAVTVESDGSEAKESRNLWSKVKENTFNKKRKIEPSWGERVLWYLAESQYQQGKFVVANDSYERLLNQYPGSPHLEKAVAREYAIAQAWFAAGAATPKPNDVSESKTAEANPAPDAEIRQASWTDHFNGRMPMIDVDGYALRTMEHVRQHDPTGRLADVATLALGDHHLAQSDWEAAASYYDQLLTEYPKSKLVQRAQLGSIDAKMKGYYGPQYDASGLEKAQVLIKQTRTAFPNADEATTKTLYHDLDLIADAQAEHSYVTGEFYRRTGYVGGAEYYFGEVSARWPNSPWSDKAKAQMVSLAKTPRKLVAPSRILTLPGSTDPNATGNSMGSMATMPGAGMGGPIGAGQ